MAQHKRRRLAHTRRRPPVILVSGPPCSGKSTMVRQQAKPGDLVIDHDAIAEAIGSPTAHDHPDELVPYVLGVTGYLLDRALHDPGDVGMVWYIRCDPSAADLALADELLIAPTAREVCKQRAIAAGRPCRILDVIDAWREPKL